MTWEAAFWAGIINSSVWAATGHAVMAAVWLIFAVSVWIVEKRHLRRAERSSKT